MSRRRVGEHTLGWQYEVENRGFSSILTRGGGRGRPAVGESRLDRKGASLAQGL